MFAIDLVPYLPINTHHQVHTLPASSPLALVAAAEESGLDMALVPMGSQEVSSHVDIGR